MPPNVEEIAAMLREASRTRTACGPVRDQLAAADIATAYEVQRVNIDHAVSTGRRIIGRKVGLTSAAVQRQLGVDQPDFGVLLDDMAYLDNARIPLAPLLQPRVEAEIALVLGQDLDQGCRTFIDVLRATEFALPAIEICASRIAGWDITIVDTVADNASSGAFILGATPVALSALDLAAVEMTLSIDGSAVSQGRGDAVLGHPLNAATWLANQAARLGAPLRAGDVVLTGALGPMVAVVAGNLVEAHLRGLGSVRATFTEGN